MNYNIENLYNEYFLIIYKYSLKISKDENLAEDIAQETFLRAIKKIDTFNQESKISTWLFTIAKNVFYEEIRKNKKYINIDDVLDIELNEEPLEDKIIELEKVNGLYKRISDLDDVTKKIVIYRIYYELSFSEIGTIFNKNENWARVKFFRGKEKLIRGENNE